MLGKRLKEGRGKRTQEEIATLLGISRARYSHYENEHVQPDNELLQRMAELYSTSVDYLLGRTNNKDSNQTRSQLSVEEQAKAFLDSLDLSDQGVLDKFNFNVDGVPLTEEQIKKFIAYVRIERATDS